jgi:hypothetical protein
MYMYFSLQYAACLMMIVFYLYFLTVLESIKDRPVLQKTHLGIPKQEIEEQISRQIEE